MGKEQTTADLITYLFFENKRLFLTSATKTFFFVSIRVKLTDRIEQS